MFVKIPLIFYTMNSILKTRFNDFLIEILDLIELVIHASITRYSFNCLQYLNVYNLEYLTRHIIGDSLSYSIAPLKQILRTRL